MSATDLLRARAAALGSDDAHDLAAAEARIRRREYGTIVVVGGGCYGSYYVRQLGRAWAAGAIRWERLLVVDRDPGCAVGRAGPAGPAPAPEIVASEWSAYFDGYLAAVAADPARASLDAIVPSPLMPHLMLEWIARRARERWPDRRVERLGFPTPPPTPWERAAPGGNHYVSFAEWTCPVNCVEPLRCPATRGPRGWSMPVTIGRYGRAGWDSGARVAGPAMFHCAHRVYGVGMFDSCDVAAADALLAREGQDGAVEMLVGTVSHCHGALGRLYVDAPLAAASVAGR